MEANLEIKIHVVHIFFFLKKSEFGIRNLRRSFSFLFMKESKDGIWKSKSTLFVSFYEEEQSVVHFFSFFFFLRRRANLEIEIRVVHFPFMKGSEASFVSFLFRRAKEEANLEIKIRLFRFLFKEKRIWKSKSALFVSFHKEEQSSSFVSFSFYSKERRGNRIWKWKSASSVSFLKKTEEGRRIWKSKTASFVSFFVPFAERRGSEREREDLGGGCCIGRACNRGPETELNVAHG